MARHFMCAHRHRTRKRRRIALALSLFIFCASAGVIFVTAQEGGVEQEVRERYLEMLTEIESQIQEHQSKIRELQKETSSLEKEVAILEGEIERTRLQIDATVLRIQRTNAEIEERKRGIERLEGRVSGERAALAGLLRTFDAQEHTPLIEVLLETENLSDFFGELHALENLQAQIHILLGEMRILKQKLEGEKESLEARRDELENLLTLQRIQRSALEEKRGRREDLLRKTRGEERRYRRLVQNAERDAEKIRRQLYELEQFGVSLAFDDALSLAKKASDGTGVRPAFLLAVLQKESRWGENLGSGNWMEDMNPNQREAFLEITRKLKLNPDTTPVSAKPRHGWGGAMGPAQFLPATWLGYEKEIAELTGHNPPSPWDVTDAFAAAALKLAHAGAYVRTPQAEWKAAMIYFAGTNWENPAFRFYGDSVLELARMLQEKIDIISH